MYSHHGDSTSDRISNAIETTSIPHDTWAGAATRQIMHNLFHRIGFTRVFLLCIDHDAGHPMEMQTVDNIAKSIYETVQTVPSAPAPAAEGDAVPAGTLPVEQPVVDTRPLKRKRKEERAKLIDPAI
jgi:hypothetical protein